MAAIPGLPIEKVSLPKREEKREKFERSNVDPDVAAKANDVCRANYS